MIGSTISHYEIIEKLGEGGMGIVYKAHDTKLDRIVALKFLPHHLSTSEKEQARLIQEAKSAAALNHPNVCSVIDLAEVKGEQFIVMEYVDGETLRRKLPIQKVDDVLAYAIQIGEALQEAHAKGVIHRDLKTENIMVNSRNQVKVMDFGLAKLKGSLKMTRTSSTVGTLAYMSPEQIEGHDADARSDIFSFGVVLYEMLSGRTPFRGEHEAAMMYSIVNEEPDNLDELRPGLPPILINLISRALEKEPGDRFQSVGDIVIELHRLQKKSSRVVRLTENQHHPSASAGKPGVPQSEDPHRGNVPGSATLPSKGSGTRRTLMLVGGMVILAGVAWLVKSLVFSTSAPALHLTFRQLTDQPGEEWYPDISPGGDYIVYSKDVSGKSHIFMERIGGGTPIDLIPRSNDDNWGPAFSPDGQSIAFHSMQSGGGIFVMGATGESVRRLTAFGYDPAWSPDGKKIVCATEPIATPYGRPRASRIWAVSVEQGTSVQLDSEDAVQPQWSPHGTRIAFWGLAQGSGRRSIFTIPSSGGPRTTVLDDGYINWDPVWSPDGGYLYFSSDRGGSLNLWRIPIDERTGKVGGAPEPITTPSAMAGFLKVSRDGQRLIYVSVDHRSNLYKIGFDPVKETVVGSPIPVTEGSKHFIEPSLSPDGEWLTFWSWEGQENIYIVRTDGKDLQQLTNDRFRNRGPVWSPDQKRIAFYSDRSGQYQIWAIHSDGSGLEQISNSKDHYAFDPKWLPDGKHIMYGTDIGAFEIDLETPFENRTAHNIVLGRDTLNGEMVIGAISHDGLHLAIVEWHGDSSIAVVYSVLTGKERQIPIWAHAWLEDGHRLLGTTLRSDSLFVVNIETGRSHPVFYLRDAEKLSYTLSPDDRTLYFSRGAAESDVWEATMK